MHPRSARAERSDAGCLSEMSLIVLYGGTFDPVHCGHMAIAIDARDYLRCEVRLLPAADPPHRVAGATVDQRVSMLQLALADACLTEDAAPPLQLDLRELRRKGPSWTVDTLRELRAEVGPQQPLALLVGSDSFRSLPEWRCWLELFGLAHFVVAQRGGSEPGQPLPPVLRDAVATRLTEDAAALRAHPVGRVFRLQQPLRAESATDVRRRIREGAAWRHLVPDAVAGYIEQHGLYRSPAGHPAHL